MVNKHVITLHIRDAVSKTFHIVGEQGAPDFQIDLHTDVDSSADGMEVPKKYHAEVMKMYAVSVIHADEILTEEEVNVSGGGNSEHIGDPAQRIWEDLISEK